MKYKNIKTKVRKNFRFPADLDQWAQEYALRNGTNVTKLLIDYLLSLKQKEAQIAAEQEQHVIQFDTSKR